MPPLQPVQPGCHEDTGQHSVHVAASNTLGCHCALPTARQDRHVGQAGQVGCCWYVHLRPPASTVLPAPPDKPHPTIRHPVVRTTGGTCHDIRIIYQGNVVQGTPLDNPDALANAAKDGARQCETYLGSRWQYVRTVNFDPQNGKYEWQHTCRICDRSLADAALMWCVCWDMLLVIVVTGTARFAPVDHSPAGRV